MRAATSWPPPGWYPDPWGQSWYRWWDGRQWTPALHPEPLAPRPARVAATFAAWAAPAVLAGTLVSIMLATWVGELIDFRENWHGVVAVYSVLFATMTLWAVLLARRFGTGRLGVDFGFRGRAEDVGWGFLAFFGALAARVVAAIVLPQEAEGPIDDLRQAVQLDRAVLVAFAVAALVGAPLIEELVFRGVLQRSLTRRLGAPVAIAIQAVLFALYHFVPSTGDISPLYFTSLALFGVAAGVVVHLTGRLGPAIMAHFLNNLLAVIVLGAT